jgi:hypothetical protein
LADGEGDLSELSASFLAHANYLRAFTHLAGFSPLRRRPVAMQEIAQKLRTQLATTPDVAAGSAAPQRPVVIACLNRAWGTELLMTMTRRYASEEELIRVGNSWSAVQAYYASYSATQALLVALGQRRPTSHEVTQKRAVDLWITRSLDVPPWTFGRGSPTATATDPQGYRHGPGRSLNETMHQWSTCDAHTCWDIAALALRHTRGRALDDALAHRRQRKLAEKKRTFRTSQEIRRLHGKRPLTEPTWPARTTLTRVERAEEEERLRIFTTLDYMYRLRIKANYEDARMFTEGPSASPQSAAVARDLIDLTAATLLIHELRISAFLGRKWFVGEVDRWLAANAPPGAAEGLVARRQLLWEDQ